MMGEEAGSTQARPSNVPQDRVVDVDIYNMLVPGKDFQESWLDLKERSAARVLWTPHNEGHWIALEGELIRSILSDSDLYSSFTVLVPKETAGAAYRLIPLSLDPPEHTPFRNLLNDCLSPKNIRPMEDRIRELTVELIEGFRADGRCNFTQDFAEKLPIRIFMRLVDLPMADFPLLKHLADQFTRPDGTVPYPEVVKRFHAYIIPVIHARRGKSGTDVLSRLCNGEVSGRPLTDLEAANIATQLLVAGLDTVINFMGYAMQFLARHPEVAAEISSNPKLIPDTIAELLRRFPLVADAREVKQDHELDGIKLRKGDMILAPTVLHGIDPAVNADPLKVDIRRMGARHSTFGSGSHFCPGSALAHMEVRVLLEEWMQRIPRFSLAPGTQLEYVSGIVGSIKPYQLVW